MSNFKIAIISFTVTVLVCFLAIFVYENYKELRTFKRNFLGVREDYRKLQKEFQDYKINTQNLRQLVVVAKNPDSNNIPIADIISKYTEKINGDISIYFKNLTTEESIVVDSDKKYYMASLYKVILTLYILEQMRLGNTTFDAKFGTDTTTLATVLDKIITESNNEYASSLAKKYGWLTIEKEMKEKLGIDFSFTENLEISVKNVGLLFEEILLSLKIPQNESNYLLKLLANQKNISKLPKYLPKNIYSHNKTGEFEEYSHDAGIFYTPKANYILVFLSKTGSPGTTNEQMALMSKEIYESLNGISTTSPLGSSNPPIDKPNSQDQVVCTQEAKLCADGKTYVSRTGPNCAFAVCPK